jgi:hypothetical protein
MAHGKALEFQKEYKGQPASCYMKNMMTMGLVFLVTFAGCIHQWTSESGKEIELAKFTYEGCTHEVDPYDKSNLGLKDVTWLTSTTLRVEVYISINCAFHVENGDFELTGSKIILKYSTRPDEPGVAAGCNCTVKLTYTFVNIQKKKYEFEIEEIMEE